MHVGDETIDAGGRVMFVDATDDGVVFIPAPGQASMQDDTDGEQRHAVVQRRHDDRPSAGRPQSTSESVRYDTANPGSLVVWADATSRTKELERRVRRLRHLATGGGRSLPYTGATTRCCTSTRATSSSTPTRSTPGCWVFDVQVCSDPHLFRHDVASGKTAEISQASFEAELQHGAASLDVGRAAGRHRDGVHRRAMAHSTRSGAGWTRGLQRRSDASRGRPASPLPLRLPDWLHRSWRRRE